MMLIGHLGQDVKVNQYDGKQVLNFSVAHTDRIKKQNGDIESKTTWVNCSWWTDSTNIAQYLKTGTQVFVLGVPAARKWEAADRSGVQLTCRVIELNLLGQSNTNQSQQSHQDHQDTNPNSQDTAVTLPAAGDVADDLPF